MTEAIFGLIGVLIGSVISWFQTYWITRRDENKNAKYLAIRVVCMLDKYMEDCTEVGIFYLNSILYIRHL